MLVGPARALFMDEISTGLDSSTTFRIVKFIKQMVHLMDETVLISLLQPAPETFELFDDVILMSEGLIVYQGPRELILEFFDNMGFKCPVRKGIADFLQEITSRKDQEQYWRKEGQPYRYITASEFSYSFESFHIGKHVEEELRIPFNKSHNHPATLATKRYGMPRWELCKACLSKEWLLMKRNAFVFVFKTVQITIMAVIATTFFLKTQMPHESIGDGGKYLGALFFCLINIMFNGVAEMYMTLIKLPVFYKQRDSLFYPPWAFGLSYIILKIPLSLLESAIWIVITYPGIGFAPTASRFFRQFLAYCVIHQMSFGLFRFIAAVGRTHVITNVCGIFALLVFFVLGGFVISKDDIQSWWIWCYWISPMMYGQNAIAVNEFLDSRWSKPNNDSSIDQPTIGKAFLKSRSLFVNEYWYWLSIGIIAGFGLLYNIFFILALTYLNPIGNSRTIILKDNEDAGNKNYTKKIKVSRLEISPNASDKPIDSDTETSITSRNYGSGRSTNQKVRQGMVLPFQPLSLIFDQVNYFVDMPVEMKHMGVEGKRLQLLCNVSGAFRPGVLTALVGVSGAGKTTLMDVLAGRKTDGYIEGSITVSGYPKKQETFTRVSGYCEQNDIHSPCISVHESLVFSAWLRLSPEIDEKIRKMFVEEIMELVELNPLRDALVGLPGVDGLSTEQRKRLTIAVELVANPSIIFMDEPTSGLDARAAAIVMRTVSNTVKTGRTVVCTIHQPSIDIFEAFDELLLMKRGGQVIYAGELGHHSSNLIEYFEKIPGVPKILEGKNPATWVLEITTSDAQLSADFAEVYFSSALYKKNQELIKELSNPTPGSKDLTFTTKYGQNFINQFTACFWKQYWSYWRNPQYNVSRFLFTVAAGLLFGTIYWRKGNDIVTQQKLLNLMGAMFTAIFFVGTSNANSVQPVMAIERTVFYRERAAGMFSPMAYAFAKVSIEVIYIVVQSLAFSLLLFSMIDFGWKKDKFFWFFLFFLMFLLYFTLFGLMAISITPNFEISGIFAIFFFLLWNLFAGFILSRKLMPKWWRWIIWANPVAWTLYGLTVSQFGDLENVIEIPGEANMDIKAFLKQRLGFEHDFLGYVVLAHVGFVLIFTFVFAYSLRILNFQKK